MKTLIEKIVTSASAALLLAVPATSFGAGFQINEHNAASTAKAGAVFATVKDPSAIFFNPAGLVHTKGTEVQVGLTLIHPSGTYVGPGIPSNRPAGATGDVEGAAKQPWVPVPNIYAARALSEKAYVGLGFYAPYGLAIEYEDADNWVGRTLVHKQALRTFFITPAIALKLSDQVAVAVSVSLVPATVYLKRTLGSADNSQLLFPKSQYGSEGTFELSGGAFGVGANAGVQLTLIDHLKLGLSFRSAVGLDFKGKADFQIPDSAPASVKANFPDATCNPDNCIRGEVTLPHSFAFGVGWQQGGLSVEAAANLTLWTSFDELRIEFDSGKPAPSSVSPKNWKTVPTFRLGGEYAIEINDDLTVTPRVGAAYDINPIPDATIDPTLPDNDRLIITGGVGGAYGPVYVDLGYMLLLLANREANSSTTFPPGTYKSRAIHLLATTVGVRF